MATMIQFALDTLFAGTALLAGGAIVQSLRTALPGIAALRDQLAAGDPLREVRVTLVTTRLVTTSVRPAIKPRPRIRPYLQPALRAAA